VSVYVNFHTASYAGLTGLLVPLFPYASGDRGSPALLHVNISLSGRPELLVVDPSAITLSVAEGAPIKPVCAIKSGFWSVDGGREYAYLGARDVSRGCERGLLGLRKSFTQTGSSTDSIPSNDHRTYDLFYPIRSDEPRPLVLRIEGIRSATGVIALPPLRYQRRSRWRSSFGAPF
jgi:hypothetical protein